MADICRICWGKKDRQNMISPCNCSGSMSLVHKQCLDNWRNQSYENMIKCPTCKSNYTMSFCPLDDYDSCCLTLTFCIILGIIESAIAYVYGAELFKIHILFIGFIFLRSIICNMINLENMSTENIEILLLNSVFMVTCIASSTFLFYKVVFI